MALGDGGRCPVVCGAAAVIGGALLILATTIDLHSHKFITSQYTYNADVFPILLEKCGRCHVDGGPAPMSLLAYKDQSGGAVAWAESIREMLIAEAMPPWFADPTGPAVKNARALSPRELDILLTWAIGGTPEGPRNASLVAPQMTARWSLGPPDLELPLPQEHVVPAGTLEDSVDVSLPTKLAEVTWVRAADLMPGTPSMVRRASIQVENGPVLAVWEPGDDVVAAPSGAAFRIPSGSTLRVRIDYKKPWQNEQEPMADRSTVGLYFTDEPLSGKAIQSVTVNGPGDQGNAPKEEGNGRDARVFRGRLMTSARVLAVRPSLDRAYSSFQVYGVVASGRRVPLLKLRAPRPEWPRRYWLADAIELPADTHIEVRAVPHDPDTAPLIRAMTAPLEVALDIIPQ